MVRFHYFGSPVNAAERLSDNHQPNHHALEMPALFYGASTTLLVHNFLQLHINIGSFDL
jgi:class 3 adenylate cyclase